MKTGSGTGSFDVDAGGGKGKIDLILLHDVHDVQVQVVLHLQKLGVDVGQQVGRDQDVDAGISEAGQLHVSSVRSAVNACLAKLGISGEVTSTSIIPRPHPQIVESLLK